MTPVLTLLFIAALAASFLLRAWLATRHMRHVGAHRDEVPGDFRVAITLDEHRKAADYTIAKTRLALICAGVDTLLTLALTLGGGIGAMQTFVASTGAPPLAAGLCLFTLFAAVSWLVSLPASLYAIFGIETRFGFRTQTLRLYALDQIKGALLTAAIGLPLAGLALWLVDAGGQAWWLWTWLAWTGTSLALLLLYPTVIAPLFNRFTPLNDPDLKARIDALLSRCGFESRGIFMMDGSTRSRHSNAYFTGLGKAKRIVFFDTLLKQLDGDEIEAVLAHELGHFHGKHIRKRMLTTFMTSLAFLFVLAQLIDSPDFYRALGVNTPGHAAGFLLFFLAAPPFTFILTPLASHLSRRHEYEADQFAARHSAADNLIRALVKLYRDNASTLTPDPVYSLFYDSHPPAALRIQHLKEQEQ
ncbi:M48 family metallopeptidase [Paludibacterium paludis]|uniref:Peptidase M48 n=1 Tax=Paludibacterium paludis TaxID=1225769 RepID=A0A918P529_9NEIS|nr:M48 family metallopeptidase [Paludibacterium paludis]GGY20536.1 peptidase M48 [Paludibacterium paludis]